MPKISSPSAAGRSAHREPQSVEQLVEVPTLLTFSFIQQLTAEQSVDIPVPRTRAGGGLHGFHPGTCSSQRSEVQNVDIPVPRARDNRGNPRGFHPGQSSSAFRGAERHVDVGFLPGQS